MAYNKTNWQDHSVENPNRYRIVENGDGSVEILREHGNVLQLGTPVNASNLNKIENELVRLGQEGENLSSSLQSTKNNLQGQIQDNKAKHYTFTLGTEWQGTEAPFTQSIVIDGLVEERGGILDVVLSGSISDIEADEEEYTKIYSSETQNNALLIKAKEKTERPLHLQLTVV